MIAKFFFLSIYVAIANSLPSAAISDSQSRKSDDFFFTNVDRPKKNVAITLIAAFFFFNFAITKIISAINQII